jgi:hypothetical protein
MPPELKEVFIFGAGASHTPGGLPLAKGLGWEYFDSTAPWGVTPDKFTDFKAWLQEVDAICGGLLCKKFEKSINKNEFFVDDIVGNII